LPSISNTNNINSKTNKLSSKFNKEINPPRKTPLDEPPNLSLANNIIKNNNLDDSRTE
jgi:hypothetical protein